MVCEKCGKEIKDGESYYTACGVTQCGPCDKESGGTVGLDFVLGKIMKETGK